MILLPCSARGRLYYKQTKVHVLWYKTLALGEKTQGWPKGNGGAKMTLWRWRSKVMHPPDHPLGQPGVPHCPGDGWGWHVPAHFSGPPVAPLSRRGPRWPLCTESEIPSPIPFPWFLGRSNTEVSCPVLSMYVQQVNMANLKYKFTILLKKACIKERKLSISNLWKNRTHSFAKSVFKVTWKKKRNRQLCYWFETFETPWEYKYLSIIEI